MAIDMDSTRIDACKADASVVPHLSPESPSPYTSDHRDLLHACSAEGIGIDHVYRVIDALDDHGGRRELGDLVNAIGNADPPLRVIELMIEHDLIRFVSGHPFDAALPVERIT